MGATYRLLKTVFRKTVPRSAKGIFFNGRTGFSKAVLTVKGRLESAAPHAEVYDAEYYANYSAEMERSAIGIADTVIEHLQPRSVIDIGCGSGEILAEFTKRGIPARGADLSPDALAICRSKGLTVDSLDLEDANALPPWHAGVTISVEVAEHLPASLADHYVHALTTMATKAIVITAAPPGQGGTDHVNEQPKEYWIEKFEAAGTTFSSEMTCQFQQAWKTKGVERTRAKNVLVFLKN